VRRSGFALIVVLSLAAIAAVAFTVTSLTNRHIAAWVLTRDASAGTLLDGSSVRQVTIPQGGDDFTVLTTAPTGKYLAHPMSQGDVLRPDDLVTQSMVIVPISFKAVAPGLQPGDSVDIYGPSISSSPPPSGSIAPGSAAASTSGQAVQLYGRGVTIVATGNGSALLVPAQYEGYWVDLSVANIDLVAVKSTGIAVPRGQTYTLQEAERMLAAIADGSAPANGSATLPPGG
jgi:hypothetical protein